MFKKIREFFRVLGELRYLIPLMRYEFPSPDDNASLAHSFEETVTQFGSNNFIYFENEKWTYNQTNEAANVLANKLIDDGVEHGDRVVLFMENRPNYIISTKFPQTLLKRIHTLKLQYVIISSCT